MKNRAVGVAATTDVYIPAGHDGRGLPLLVDLVGFTSKIRREFGEIRTGVWMPS
jgi:hypothetical protein